MACLRFGRGAFSPGPKLGAGLWPVDIHIYIYTIAPGRRLMLVSCSCFVLGMPSVRLGLEQGLKWHEKCLDGLANALAVEIMFVAVAVHASALGCRFKGGRRRRQHPFLSSGCGSVYGNNTRMPSACVYSDPTRLITNCTPSAAPRSVDFRAVLISLHAAS